MNKNLIIGVVVVALIAIGGFLFVNSSKKTPSDSMMGQEQEGGNVFTSIKDALSQSISLECTYEDPEQGTTKAYIKNGAVRVDHSSSDPANSGSSIIKDKMMYFWNSEGAFKMAVPDGDEMMEDKEDASSGKSDPNDVIEGIEKYKESCRPASVSDSLFTPPADREFQDFSQLMEGAMQDSMKQSDSDGNPSMPSQEQIDQMMKQYGNQ